MAGCCSTASSRSAKRPSTCRRMTSFSSVAAVAMVACLSADTAKWLVQKCTSRSRNGCSLATAARTRALACSR